MKNSHSELVKRVLHHARRTAALAGPDYLRCAWLVGWQFTAYCVIHNHK